MALRHLVLMEVRIKDLPEGVQILALMEQEKQGNKPNRELLISSGVFFGNFEWSRSIQGSGFWMDAYDNYIKSTWKEDGGNSKS